MENVTYSINAETLDNISLILTNRPGVKKSYLIRELIAAEADRIREKLEDIGAETKIVREELRSVREKVA
jgi:hypothetical protein